MKTQSSSKIKLKKFSGFNVIARNSEELIAIRRVKSKSFNLAFEKCVDFMSEGNRIKALTKAWVIFDNDSNVIEITDDVQGFCKANGLSSNSMLYSTNKLKANTNNKLKNEVYKGYYTRELSHIVSGIAYPLLSEIYSDNSIHSENVFKARKRLNQWVIKDIREDTKFEMNDVQDTKEVFSVSNPKSLYMTSSITPDGKRKRKHVGNLQITRMVDLINGLLKV